MLSLELIRRQYEAGSSDCSSELVLASVLAPDKLWKCSYHICYPFSRVTSWPKTGHWDWPIRCFLPSDVAKSATVSFSYDREPALRRGQQRVKTYGTTGYSGTSFSARDGLGVVIRPIICPRLSTLLRSIPGSRSSSPLKEPSQNHQRGERLPAFKNGTEKTNEFCLKGRIHGKKPLLKKEANSNTVYKEKKFHEQKVRENN